MNDADLPKVKLFRNSEVFFVGIYIYFLLEMVSEFYIVLRFSNFPLSSSLALFLET